MKVIDDDLIGLADERRLYSENPEASRPYTNSEFRTLLSREKITEANIHGYFDFPDQIVGAGTRVFWEDQTIEHDPGRRK